MHGILAGADRCVEYFGGYEPLYFPFLAGVLILAAAFLFAGEIRPRTEPGASTEVLGPLMLLLFILLPVDGRPALTILAVLTACAALFLIPRFYPKCPPAAIMIGCAAAGLPAAMFQLVEPIIILAAALFQLVLFPRKWRIPAAVLTGVMLAARLFLPVSLVGSTLDGGRKETAPSPETLRALSNLTLLACSEAASVPAETYQCITEHGGSIRSPGNLALAVLKDNMGEQNLKQYVESDVLRRETLSSLSSRLGIRESGNDGAVSSPEKNTADQNMTAPEPRIFLFDPGRPKNLRQNYRCTENFFRRLKEKLPGDAIIGFLLPEEPIPYTASILSALRSTFPHTALFLFPTPMVLASPERALSVDPEELDRRAVQGKVYDKLFSPYHILNLALPHFQEPVAVSSLLDAASRATPNRTDRLIPLHDPASKMERYFSAAVGISLPLTGVLFVLYFLLRYFTGWKPKRKIAYRSLEAGFLFAGSAFFLAAPFLRYAEPDPARWFTVCVSVAALGTAWAFGYVKGPLSVKLIPRVILPLLSLALFLYFEPHEVWGLFLAAMLTGPAWKNAFACAASPLTGGNGSAVFPLSAVMLGAALALLLIPPLFFVSGGMYAAACLLAAILITRRPAAVPQP